MFILVLMNVFFLISYSRQRVEGLFHDYLTSQGGSPRLGPYETNFLFTFHESMVWVGLACCIIGLLMSYWLARHITISIRKLHKAVENFEQGIIEEKVVITSRDEIGLLANAFNRVTEALAINQRLRKRLFADIAHELTTPLTVVKGNLEGMLYGFVDRDNQQITSIYEEVELLSKLIADLRVLSLAEAKQLDLEISPIDMNLFLAKIVQLLKPLADEKEVRLNYEPHGLSTTYGDSKRIHQIFYNLVSNALRYTPANGAITLSLKEIGQADNTWLQVDIIDTGLGIAEADLPYIFERFYRTGRARDRKSGGSGLGLAIVKELVEIHNGRVMVTSQLGAGSTFTVYLPAGTNPQALN